VSDIEQFWSKIHDASGVKNCTLFEGVRPDSCNLARRVMNPKIAWGTSKIRLFTSSSYFLNINNSESGKFVNDETISKGG